MGLKGELVFVLQHAVPPPHTKLFVPRCGSTRRWAGRGWSVMELEEGRRRGDGKRA